MFFKLALIATAAFAALAVASPAPGYGAPSNNQCQTGEQQCCQSVESAGSPKAKSFLDLIDAVVDADAVVGLTCSPVSALGIGSGCQQTEQSVCCTGNNFNGLVVIGCSPINL